MTHFLSSSVGMAPSALIASQFPQAAQAFLPHSVVSRDGFFLQVDPSSAVKAWFTDMDGTLFDGKSPPSAHTATVFQHLAHAIKTIGMPFVYVTGRNISLIEKAIQEYGLPFPSYAAGSVGTQIFRRDHDRWQEVEAYSERLRSHWVSDPESAFDPVMEQLGVDGWWHSSATEFRRSYRVPPSAVPIEVLRKSVLGLLKKERLDTIKSVVSGPGNAGYLHVDFLPSNGSKVDAGNYIARELIGLEDLSSVLFTGDSGNDEDLLVATGLSSLVRTGEKGLAQRLLEQCPDIFLSPHPNIYGVVHSMIHFGVIAVHPI